jgi:hypothetical protein
VPVEVKSSGSGAMHSLRSFLKEKGTKKGIRISTEPCSRLNDVLIVPLYAVSELERLWREDSAS